MKGRPVGIRRPSSINNLNSEPGQLQNSPVRKPAAIFLGLIFAASFVYAEVEGTSGDLSWKLSGEARFRPEFRDDLDLNSDLNDDLRQGFMRMRLGFDATYKNSYRVFIQVQDSRIAGQEGSTASNEENLDLHQGYLELPGFGNENLSLTIGRQEWKYGEQRLIGSFGWHNVGRSFDGARLRYSGEKSKLDALLARVSTDTVAGASEGSDLFGLQWQRDSKPNRQIGAYWLVFSESVQVAGERTGPLPAAPTAPIPPTINMPDGILIHAVGGRIKDRWDAFDVNAEIVAQSGEFHGDDLTAQAGAAQVGFNFGDQVALRLFAGYDYASGDKNPNDGEREEFFNFFPTNHGHYGYADMEGWRNIRSPYAGISMKKGRHFWLAKYHSFQLDEAAGPWKNAGGAVLGFDPTGGSGRNVGTEIDVIYKLKSERNISYMAGVSRFEPGRFAKLTRGGDASLWAFAMITAAF
jgi:hypothetical protein